MLAGARVGKAGAPCPEVVDGWRKASGYHEGFPILLKIGFSWDMDHDREVLVVVHVATSDHYTRGCVQVMWFLRCLVAEGRQSPKHVHGNNRGRNH